MIFIYRLFSMSLVLLISVSSRSQTVISGSVVADSVQESRSIARKLWYKANPEPIELDQSITLLDNALSYVNDPKFKDLAQGNMYLYFRNADVNYDLINAYTRSRKYDKALLSLKKYYNAGYLPYNSLEKDSAFSVLRQQPEFDTIINKFKIRAALWQGNAFKTALQPNLSVDEKVAGLSLLWSQAKYNFVHFDHLNIDWNQVYLDYLPLVRATETTAEYYKVLQKFYAQLKDGHTNVYLDVKLARSVSSRPPIRTELIEGRVFITAVYSESLENTGIVPGLEIISIDNDPVIHYAEENIKPYQSSSTPQDLEIREFSYALLNGDADKPVVLTLKDKRKKVFTRAVPRSGYTVIKTAPSIEFKHIGDIGYLQVNSFENEKIIGKYDSLFTEIAKTKSLIIDIRNNGGGDSNIGYSILQTLTNKPFPIEASRFLQYNFANSTKWFENSPGSYQPDSKRFYDRPVVVLTSARTFSAAEDFLVAFAVMKRGKLIGQRTGGSTGQPFSFSLPGGGWARVCAVKNTYPDGREFVGIGISPDITINRTIADLWKGTDPEMNKALELLRSQVN